MSTGRGDLADNEPPPPSKGPATGAMRLRPATRPGAPAEVARERAAGAIDALEQQLAESDQLVDALEARLDAVLELHTPHAFGPQTARLCRECLTSHPCQTRRLAEVVAGTRTPPEEGSQ